MNVRLPRALVLFAVIVVSALACRSATVADDAVYACNDGKCPEPLVCRDNFCVSPQAATAAPDACTPFTCELLGKNCGTLTDGCGGTLNCGNCTGTASCGGGGVTNVCGCTPIPEAAMCADAGYACGTFFFSDGCNPPKSVSCGGCEANEVCNGGSCCTPESDTEVCAAHGITCGIPTLVDRCGQHRTINCGGCDAGEICVYGDDGQACMTCTPETDYDFCNRNGFNCGSASGVDNCGNQRTVSDCGACGADAGCGGNGVANLCECQPNLTGCSRNDQCCTGNCGGGGLCCAPQGGACNDDSDCCTGWCAWFGGPTSVCTGADGGL